MTTTTRIRAAVYTLAVMVLCGASLALHAYVGSKVSDVVLSSVPRAIASAPAPISFPTVGEFTPSVGTLPSAPTTPPCTVETAEDLRDGQACRWDASTAGNGVGESFTAERFGDVIMYTYDSGPAVYMDMSDPDASELLEVGDGWSPPTDGVDDFDWSADTDSDR